MIPAALWLRVSSSEQETANQVPEAERFAGHHDYEIRHRYTVDESAWNGGRDNGEYRRTLKAALDGAWRGEYKVLIIWSLDRLTRGGIEDALRLFREFRERGVVVVSVQEPWLNGSEVVTELLMAIMAWVAQQESQRRSERIRAGIARAKAEGKIMGGRKPGAKDRRPRKKRSVAAAG